MKIAYVRLAFILVTLSPAASSSQYQYQFSSVMVRDSIIVAGGNWGKGGIYRSADYGRTWSNVGFRSIVLRFYLDSTNGYAATLSGLHVSSDTGASWTGIDKVGFDDPDVYDVVTYGNTILAVMNSALFRSTNQGEDWENLLGWSPSRSFYCVLEHSGILYAGQTAYNNDGVYRSTDGGTTWSPLGLSNTIVNRLSAAGPNLLAGSTAPYAGILLSTDDGASWKEVLAYIETFQVTDFETTGYGIYASSRNGVFRSTDDGVTWKPIGLAGTVVNGLSANLRDLFAATNNGLYRCPLGDTSWQKIPFDDPPPPPASVPGDGSGVPGSFALAQNYPNPFNPSTVINYTVGGVGDRGPGASRIRLAVYDVLGREVAVLVDERRTPGSYEVTFDGSGLSSGVYVCRLMAGTCVQSKTMLLIR